MTQKRSEDTKTKYQSTNKIRRKKEKAKNKWTANKYMRYEDIKT